MNEEGPRTEGSPFTVDCAFRTRHDFESGLPVTNTIVTTVADVTDVNPFEMPLLNRSVDPDALDEFVGPERDAAAESGDAPLVVFPLFGRFVGVTDDGRIAISEQSSGDTDDVRDVLGVDASADAHTARREPDSDEELPTTVVRTVASVSGRDPVEVREGLDDVVDLHTVADLFQTRRNGTGRRIGGVQFSFREYVVTVFADETIVVRSALMGLKRTGGNLLLVGSVPDDVITSASAPLLGANDLDRTRLFTLYETTVDTARERLSQAGHARGGSRVINCRAEARSTAAVQNAPSGLRISDVSGGFDALPAAIADAIEEIDRERGGLDPAELRFCFDSLGSLVRDHDVAAVAGFLESICESVGRVSGMGHYVLPTAYDADPVRRLESLFDAVVELRVGPDGPEQRWHLQETGYTTEWFPV